MPANNPQAYIGLLLLVVPAFTYYFVVNRDTRKSFLYLITFFGSLFAVKLLVGLFSVNIGQWASAVNVIIAVSLSLYLTEAKVEFKNLAWLAGIVIVAQMFLTQYLGSVSFV